MAFGLKFDANVGGASRATFLEAATIGVAAGLVGSITIWIYEYIVLFGLLHQGTAMGVVQHTSLLAFGPGILSTGVVGFILGAVIHCVTGIVWAIGFALIWPVLSRLKIEATFAALVWGVVAWLVMHVFVLAFFSPDPPIYTVYSVINGFMSHMVAFCVPMALTVKGLFGRRGSTN